MKIAIIGSREFSNKEYLNKSMQTIKDKYNISLIVSGGAKGADTLGERWANKNKIKTKIFLPDFKRKHPYFYRDRLIAEEADLVIAFWNGRSSGTRYTIDYSRKISKEVIIFKF